MTRLKYIFLTGMLSIMYFFVPAQSNVFLPEKAGSRILKNKLNDCAGKKEKPALTASLTKIAEWVYQHDSVLNKPRGFDAVVSLVGNYCDRETKKENYGIEGSVYFAFHDFYLENGIPKTATGNIAFGTTFLINNPLHSISSRFTETGFKTGDPPWLKAALEKALENLQNYYSVAPFKKEIAPGIRLYSNNSWNSALLVFNPDRPDFLIPVTVREIMEVQLAYYKIKQQIDSINYEKTLAAWAKMNFKPEKSMLPALYDEMKKEYERFSAEELNLPAYTNVQTGISGINARGEGSAVMKFNPDCWDLSLPATSIQFLSIEYRPATETELEAFKKRNGGLMDYTGIFYNALPIEKLEELIDKK